MSSRCKRTFRQTGTFQIVLCVVLFHSLASILIIYVHLAAVDEDTTLWAAAPSSIVWNEHSLRNALSGRLIRKDELSVVGWWMDHARWDVDVRCLNQHRVLCSTSFSSGCRADRTRALYQHLTFPQQQHVRGLEFAVTATTDQLEPQAVGSLVGALALVVLRDGRQEMIQIQFPSNADPLSRRSGSFFSAGASVRSVTLMLACYGCSGSVHFTDPILHVSSRDERASKEPCPPRGAPAPIRVENIVQSERSNHSRVTVTLVSQVSMERLATLERALRAWDGPVSLAVHAPAKQQHDWQRLYIQKKLKGMRLSEASDVALAFGENKEYPINALRNIAINNAKTQYIFLLDADFQPSPNFQQRFSAFLKRHTFPAKTVFVVPAFEYTEFPQKNDNAPQSKEELLQLLHREEPFILPFRIAESSESHRNTDYWRWYRSDKPYTITTFCDKYEPYVVLAKSNSVPLYDETFTGYGMNKVTHATELFAANYSFVVLPDVWVVHLPHKISTYALDFLQSPQRRLQNRVGRFQFLSNLIHGSCEQEFQKGL